MNARLEVKKLKISSRQWVIFFLVLGIFHLHQSQSNILFAGRISFDHFGELCALPSFNAFCNEDDVIDHTMGNGFFSVIENRPKPKRIQRKPAIKSEENLYAPIVLKAANEHKIDPAIIMAIIMAESGYNPRAVSKKGAQGLMQLMPRTAKALGVKNPFNPSDNINGGVKYFKKNLNKFKGNIKLALAAYNAGSRNVQKYRGVPPFRATKIYVKKVLKYYEVYKKHTIEAES